MSMLYGELANESAAYRAARAELLQAEVALRDQREKVAALRRQLPLDTEVEDYLFHEGPRDLSEDGPIAEVHLSELFDKPDQPLVVYQFMYGVAQENPCTSCTMWTEGLDGVAHHLAQQVNLAVIAAADIGDWRAWGRERGWRRVRLVSSAGTSFKEDFKLQDEDGDQYPGVSVFVKKPDGALAHFYTASAILGKDEYRGIDLLSPVWNLLDLTPNGRQEDWYPDTKYGT